MLSNIAQTTSRLRPSLFLAVILLFAGSLDADEASVPPPLSLAGQSVTPHIQSSMMRYRQPINPELGARVELFLRNDGEKAISLSDKTSIRFDGNTPQELIDQNQWAWHDTVASRGSSATRIPPGALLAWRLNTMGNKWGTNTGHQIDIAGQSIPLSFDRPTTWLSAITFLSSGDQLQPDTIVVHVANDGSQPIRLIRCRLWLPRPQESVQVFYPGDWQSHLQWFGNDGLVPPKERNGFQLKLGPLPLTYTVVEVEYDTGKGKPESLWAQLRIKREVFDISGGWIDSKGKLATETLLKTYKRMHLNTGHFGEVSGYTDNPVLYEKYPLKRFNKLENLERYDRDEMLPQIHAVEFLGEPQYGGGTPVPPQKVWEAFVPYHKSRLPTTVTHSEERIWRYYAGLSDYPHYDAYRITAPAADAWSRYDRWGGEKIRWAAPLETIGEMTRSLRELNRPRPIAYWSQGAHSWRSWSRKRGSPTPAELRSQAYHALGQRITSLYWFNLSLESLLRYPDLINPITRVNREILMLEPFLLEGDAYNFESVDGFDLSSVTGPRGGLLFINDIGYEARDKELRFSPRKTSSRFRLPVYLRGAREILKLGANGVEDVDASFDSASVTIHDTVEIAGLYILTRDPAYQTALSTKWKRLLEEEARYEFDPGNRSEDLAKLKSLATEP